MIHNLTVERIPGHLAAQLINESRERSVASGGAIAAGARRCIWHGPRRGIDVASSVRR